MQSRDPFVYTRRGVHPRESLPNEIRDGAALLAGQISEAGVHGFVKIELRAHHVMYIHRGRLSVNRSELMLVAFVADELHLELTPGPGTSGRPDDQVYFLPQQMK